MNHNQLPKSNKQEESKREIIERKREREREMIECDEQDLHKKEKKSMP
jgi:hypothetical protein